MTCRWILPCRRRPAVFYLGGFFCSYHARLIQARDVPAQLGDAALLRGGSDTASGVEDHPQPPAPPLTEQELFDVLERDYWQDEHGDHWRVTP